MSSKWSKLNTFYYNKYKISELVWSITEFNKYYIDATIGGTMVMTKKYQYIENNKEKNTIYVYNSNGKLITFWNYNQENNNLIALKCTGKDKILLVFNDGTIRLYNLYGENIKLYSLPSVVVEDGVADVVFYNNGLCARTSLNQFFVLYNLGENEEFQMYELANATHLIPSTALSMLIIPPEVSASKSIEVLVANSTGSILSLDRFNVVDLHVQGTFTHMVLSPNGSFIALYSVAGALSIVNAECNKFISEFNTGSNILPLQINWCADDSVLLCYEKLILMVGPFGDFVKWNLDSSCFLFTELDGCRIFYSDNHEFVIKVSKDTEEIFRLGSVAGPALLYDAAEAYTLGDIKANENIKSISDMTSAVESCMNAAILEYDTAVQTQLLQAASFGKAYLDDYNPDSFVETCLNLRILNNIRNQGYALSIAQYNLLDPGGVIDRLVDRREYSLALSICNLLSYSPLPVLVSWSLALISSSITATDSVLYERIITRIQKVLGEATSKDKVGYSEMAQAAVKAGRKELAIRLLSHEPTPSLALPLYLSMREYSVAIQVAISSGNADLVYVCLFHMSPILESDMFMKIVAGFPVAAKLWVKYCIKTGNLDWVKNYYYAINAPKLAADVLVREAYCCTSLDARLRGLEIAESFYKQHDLFSEKAIKSQLNLLLIQREESKAGFNVVDLSLTTMLERYIASTHSSVASLKQLFAIPDVRFQHIMVKTLAKCGRWSELAELKPSAIGYYPFVEVCMEEKAFSECAKYVKLLPDVADQMEVLCAISYFREAAEIAWAGKDRDSLNNIRALCKNPSVNNWIDSLLATKF